MSAARELISLESARTLVIAESHHLDPEPVAVVRSQGRVLAGAIVAAESVPPFDNSAMDGFAVRADDTAGASEERTVELRLAGESRAGRPADIEVATGEAIAVSTGAPLPDGADAVVPLEDAERHDGVVKVALEAAGGRYVRRRGDDVVAGEPLLAAGTRIGPAELGVLASQGITEVPCARRPRLSLVINGDELADPGAPLAPGQIHDSNGLTLAALAGLSGAELVASERVPDDLAQIREALEAALQGDIVVVSGGVSVGEHDHVKQALRELGVREVFWGVAVRPGRPTWFGVAPDGALVLGLPGNPVSAMVCFILFVRPALLSMQGADPDRPRATAILDSDYPKPQGRAHAVRCTLDLRDDGWHVRPTRPEQASHVLTSMLGADALALIPAESGDVTAGRRVEIELLS